MPKVRIAFELRLNEYFALVSELLPGAEPMGAYCMGLSVTLVASPNKWIWPTREVLLQLRACETVKAGVETIERWVLLGVRRTGIARGQLGRAL
jgi:hypothetical protein